MRCSIVFLLVFSFLVSCQNTNDKDLKLTESQISDKEEGSQRTVAQLTFVTPQKGVVIKRTEVLDYKVELTSSERSLDSVHYFLNDKRIYLDDVESSLVLYKAGKNIVKATAFLGNDEVLAQTHIIVVSDEAPEKKVVKSVKKYPHDVAAYTQGLIFTNGYLYEGTGQLKESMLKKIDLEKNDLIQSFNLPGEVFGEGIVLHKNQIFQLTWQSRRAFVYDLKTMEQIHEFEYYTEGWGITNYYDKMIMSDGTPNLYILDPESFSVTNRLQVANHIGLVNNLNELEWINGKIWANVYLTNTIVIINPETGFVETKLDLTHLVPDTYANSYDNVLNGIAYDEKSNRIFVTGKRWPVLYEISVR